MNASQVNVQTPTRHHHEPRYSRGQFRKFANKVIEWIRNSLALGKNEVFNFSFISYNFSVVSF